MELRRYDGQAVRITDTEGEVFEGVCGHKVAEYCLHEYGREEEGLSIANFLFYRDDILAIESLEGRSGPWGRFSAPWGRIEERNADEGMDCIDEELFCEEDEHVIRLLRCLGDRLEKSAGSPPDWAAALPKALRELLKLRPGAECRTEAERFPEKWI